MNDNKPVRNLLLSFIKSRSKLFLFERYRYKSYKDSINWDYISRFDYYPEDQIICSICLNEPILPRMDKCGHIFCLSCLINFCKHENSTYVLCPICKNYNIHVMSTKRVTLAEQFIIKLGDTLKFMLLVKGNNSLFPDYYHKLVNPLPNAPLSTEGHSNFSNISVDNDSEIMNFIESDIATLNENSSSIGQLCGDDIVATTRNFLYNEKAEFMYNISVDCTSVTKTTKGKPTDCFNIMLGTNNQLERFIMFFQCTKGRFVLLEPFQNSKLIATSYSANRIIGNVKSIRFEKVTPSLINETKLTHLPLGSTVTFVQLTKIHKMSLPRKSHKQLLKHKEIIITDKINMEKMRLESVVKRAGLAERGIVFTPMVENISSKDLGDTTISRLSEDSYPPSFNLCMLGLSCDDPDDDYPHAENCHKFKSLNVSSNSEDQKENYEDVQSSLFELKETSTFTEAQINVIKPEKTLKVFETQATFMESVQSQTVIDKLDKYNYPPDDIKNVSMFMKKDPFLSKYIVQAKKGSQRDAKNNRKKAKS